MAVKRLWAMAALTPLPESAATSRRSSGEVGVPATSGMRWRIHTAARPLPHSPRTSRVSIAA